MASSYVKRKEPSPCTATAHSLRSEDFRARLRREHPAFSQLEIRTGSACQPNRWPYRGGCLGGLNGRR